jgi:hypothetical protein
MKKVFWLGVLALFLFGLYSIAKAGHAYVTISNLMDEVVPRHIGAVGVPDQLAATERNERIKGAVAQSVTEAGIPIERSAVSFSEERGTLFVRVEHQYPVVTWQGETKAAIPVAVTSKYLLPPPRN